MQNAKQTWNLYTSKSTTSIAVKHHPSITIWTITIRVAQILTFITLFFFLSFDLVLFFVVVVASLDLQINFHFNLKIL